MCPTRRRARFPASSDSKGFSAAFRDPVLLRLNFGIFALHASLMSLFVQFPLSLRAAGLPGAEHWKVYLPVMVVSFLLVAPLFSRADRRRTSGKVMAFALCCLAAAQGGLAWLQPATPLGLALVLLVFFAGLNVLEAALPAEVSPPRAGRIARGRGRHLQQPAIFGRVRGRDGGRLVVAALWQARGLLVRVGFDPGVDAVGGVPTSLAI